MNHATVLQQLNLLSSGRHCPQLQLKSSPGDSTVGRVSILDAQAPSLSELFGALPSRRELVFAWSSISDDSMSKVGDLSYIEGLSLTGPRITGRALPQIRK